MKGSAGIGIDIVEIDRFHRAFRREGFREKVFTRGEIKACEAKRDPLPSYAARFAVKEAFFKAIKWGDVKTVPWTQIETVIADDVPFLQLSPDFKEKTAGLSILISLTHTERIAGAVVLLLPVSNTTPQAKIKGEDS